MLDTIKTKLKAHLLHALQEGYDPSLQWPPIDFETPADKEHGDLSCNIALKSAKILKKPPVELAQDISTLLEKQLAKTDLNSQIKSIEVKKPGFINFYFQSNAFVDILSEVFLKNESYGKSNLGAKQKIQIEFVSANPTGPLSIAHARQAA